MSCNRLLSYAFLSLYHAILFCLMLHFTVLTLFILLYLALTHTHPHNHTPTRLCTNTHTHTHTLPLPSHTHTHTHSQCCGSDERPHSLSIGNVLRTAEEHGQDRVTYCSCVCMYVCCSIYFYVYASILPLPLSFRLYRTHFYLSPSSYYFSPPLLLPSILLIASLFPPLFLDLP